MNFQESEIIAKFSSLLSESREKYSSNGHHKIAAANETYNKLVTNGIIKKRGFTLRGIEDTHLLQVRIN